MWWSIRMRGVALIGPLSLGEGAQIRFIVNKCSHKVAEIF